MFKKRILFFFLFAFSFFKADATHLMGGEITWDCAGGGQYVFTLKLYRDCNGASVSPAVTLDVFNHPSVSSITLNLVAQNDISPSCNAAGPGISCAAAEAQPGWPSSSSTIAGAVQESTYQSAPISLPGVPPAAGWIFTYVGCCRNGSISNLVSPVTVGYTLRAIMHAFNGQNANPCFDSSPKFLESPSSIICLGTPFRYNHNAYDPDLDSLYYSWAQPYDKLSSGATSFNPPTDPLPATFSAGYSFTSPLPGTAQNAANIPATINSATGEISFTSVTQGSFVTVVKVESWKCGQLVAEIFREMQIVLLPCAPNTVPSVTYTTYQDTVIAGTLVNFTMNASDPDLLADGITPQTLSITATGNQFGAGYTNASSGCSSPPCATLSPAPPISSPSNANVIFNWQTSCNHVTTATGCSRASNTYTFVFKTQDDFCPAPAENISTVSITVLPLPLVASPKPKCVSVQPNGDVVLNWIPSSDPAGTFNSYQIYSSNTLAGPYTLIDSSFTLTQNTYTHVGANANTVPVFYYIEARSGCGGQISAPAADTVRTILLNVTNPGNGTAVLTWNTIALPAPSTSSGIYNVYEEYPTGVWTLTGTTPNLFWVDSIFICNSTINFRVEIYDSSGCTSVSSVDGNVFQNTIVPAIPMIDTLSVDDNNDAMMNWNVSPSEDVVAYIVFRLSGGIWIPVDTVFGINSDNYTYLPSTAGANMEYYRLTAYDSCGNVSALGTPFSTIYLTTVADVCARSAILNWTAYPTLGTGLAGYNVYQATASAAGPYTLLGTVSASTLTYTASGLLPNTTYYYKVEAFDAAGKTVSSNRRTFFSAVPVPPVYSYLRKASVIDPDKIEITCHVDTLASTLSYKIMRSSDTIPTAGSYTQVGSVPAGTFTPIVFTDATAVPDKFSYHYKIINVDSCGYDGLETNVGKTMLLHALSDTPNNANKIAWNDYETWSGNVMSYNIYRGMDGVMDPNPIANVPFTNAIMNTYVDDISMITHGEGVFNYQVEALEGMGNTYGFSDNAMSNIAEAYQGEFIYIPNAFRPGSFNSVFKPVTTFTHIDGYTFMVFNRWGLNVFLSTDINEGWDGTHNGVNSGLGVYVYLLQYKNSRGEYIERKGYVTLIR